MVGRDLSGYTLGEFVLRECMSTGGVGDVYLGAQLRLGRGAS